MLSHVEYFKISLCGFNNQMHLHLSSFIINAAQTPSWSGLSDLIYIHLECVSEGIYTWSFQDRIAIWSEKHMKWPGVNGPYNAAVGYLYCKQTQSWHSGPKN